MDALDLALLRHLYGPSARPTGIPTPWELARKVGAHGTTVKRRLARLRRRGVLAAVRLAPHPALLRATPVFAWWRFPDPAAKARGLRALGAQPDVMEVHDFVGDEAAAWVYALEPESPERALGRLRRLAGAEDAFEIQRWSDGRAPVATPLDARILAELVPEAHRPLGQVARACRVTPKTVRARLRGLARAGAFVTYPSVDFARISGAVGYVLLAEAAPRGRGGHAAFLRAFPDHVCASGPGARLAYAYLVAHATDAVAAALDVAAALPGLARPRVLLVRGLASAPGKVAARLLEVAGVPGGTS